MARRVAQIKTLAQSRINLHEIPDTNRGKTLECHLMET